MPDIPNANRPPMPATSIGAGDTPTGTLTRGESASEVMATGSSPQPVLPAAPSNISADGTRVFQEGGQIFSQGYEATPVGFVPSQPGPGGNTTATTTPHMGQATPPPAQGAQGTVKGQTVAKPRSTFDPSIMGGSAGNLGHGRRK
jgi:hypothetical protein